MTGRQSDGTSERRGKSGQIGGHPEVGGGGPYHFCGILQSGGTGGAPVRGGDVGLISGHGEADSGGPHVFFLRQVTGKRERRRQDGTWRQEGAESVLKAAGTQDIRTYINRRQAKVAQWVAVRPIFEICVRETGYEGRGRRRTPWWRQTAADAQLRATLKEISADARERRRRESGRRGGRGDQQGADNGERGQETGQRHWGRATPR